jgi:serine/threonine-protein kinase
MGEVYRAKDTRLDRTVAIKVLPSHLSSNPDLRQRFEREARTVSSLSHPHICTLHDIGHQDGIDFLVMEFLEGETLTQRLSKGPLPTDQVLRYAIEIADALDKAHKQSIVHRDLKPGNIMLTKSGAKLLDFGLAKFQESAPLTPMSGVSALATEQKQNLTAEGSIIGTTQYMAPEQLEGKEADSRTDIFAFGLVLYEMITGKRAFTGKSPASLIAAILEKEPEPISASRPLTPPALDRAVKICLAKDPDERWQNVRDLMNELKWIREGSSQAGVAAPVATRRKSRERLAWLLAGALALSTAFLGFLLTRETQQSAPADRVSLRLQLRLPKEEILATSYSGPFAVSPDGMKFAYTVVSGATSKLRVRSMDTGESIEVPGTEGAAAPFFSPDSKWIAFSAARKLKKVSLAGGAPIIIADAPDPRGGVWSVDGKIYFVPNTYSAVSAVSSDGGTVKVITQLRSSEGEQQHRWPEVLPDGKAILFTAGFGGEWDDAKIIAQRLDTGERKVLINGGTYPRYLPTGHLVYARAGSLYAVPLNATSLSVIGQPVEIAKHVQISLAGYSFATFSAGGFLVSASTEVASSDLALSWIDRAGKAEPIPAGRNEYYGPAISPDGGRVAIGVVNSTFILDLSRNVMTKLTSEARTNTPIWTSDGKKVLYGCEKGKFYQIYSKAADDSGVETLLFPAETQELPTHVSHDGNRLLFYKYYPGGETEMRVSKLTSLPNEDSILLLRAPSLNYGQFSPDDRWVAYTSSESGQSELYVRPAGGEDRKWQVSTEGGTNPLWSPGSREILYVCGTKVMAVPYQAGESFSPGVPKVLFENHLISSMDINPKGDRFFAVENPRFGTETTLDVTTNWFSEIRRKTADASRP